MRVNSGADGNEMRKNVLNRNKTYGIYDEGGSGTDNDYYDNVCKNNPTNSAPSGLCKN